MFIFSLVSIARRTYLLQIYTGMAHWGRRDRHTGTRRRGKGGGRSCLRCLLSVREVKRMLRHMGRG